MDLVHWSWLPTGGRVPPKGSTMSTTDLHAEHDVTEHEHGDGCGHTTVQHDDHVDYAHGTHRHALHGDHYDEHGAHAEHAAAADRS
jgi:hypothetical protein